MSRDENKHLLASINSMSNDSPIDEPHTSAADRTRHQRGVVADNINVRELDKEA
jgi:hypothetical protein